MDNPRESVNTHLEAFKKLKSLQALEDNLRSIPLTVEEVDAYSRQFSGKIYLDLLAIASFNQNGFVRARALSLLSGTGSPEAIRYLLLRAADWVPQIREAALAALQLYIQPPDKEAFIHGFIVELPFVERLLQIKRVDLSGLHSQIIRLITTEIPSADHPIWLTMSEKSRFLFFGYLLQKKALTPQLLDLLLKTKSFLIKTLLFDYLPTLSIAAREMVVFQLLQDRTAAIRLRALYAGKSFVHQFQDRLYSLLSDESASIRELARRFLGDKTIDFAGLYRLNLRRGEKRLGNIRGLGELGSKEDIPLFIQLLNDPSQQIQYACLLALKRLDDSLVKEFASSFLFSPSKKIRLLSCEILSRDYDQESLEQIRAKYELGTTVDKKTILLLLNRIGGWTVVADLIRAVSDRDTEISELAWEFLAKWKVKATRNFTTPPARDLTRAKTAYEQTTRNLIPMNHHQRQLWGELPFFLR